MCGHGPREEDYKREEAHKRAFAPARDEKVQVACVQGRMRPGTAAKVGPTAAKVGPRALNRNFSLSGISTN